MSTLTNIEAETPQLNETHHSDGSELIPAEVQANIRHDVVPSLDHSAATNYTVDEEGLLNNYAIEPDIYPSDYPSVKQQKRYVFLGAAAILFVGILVLISFVAS